MHIENPIKLSYKSGLLFSALFLLASPNATADKSSLDASFLQPAQKAIEPSKNKNAETAPKKPVTPEDLKTSPTQEAVTYETIESLTDLLKMTPAGPQRNNLLLNRSAAMSLYARTKHLTSHQAVMIDALKNFLKASIRDAEIVERYPGKTREQIERIHFLIGYAYVYLDSPSLASARFTELLRLKPDSENAGWIALYVAEDLFERGNFQEAAKYYSGFQNKMSAQGRDLALYKLAWCKINLGQNDEAENYFMSLALAGGRPGLRKERMNDLAYLVTHRKNPESAIWTKFDSFKAPEDKLDFLTAIRAKLEVQNYSELHNKVVLRLLTIEKDRGKILELLLADLRTKTKQYGDHASAHAFDKLVSQIQTDHLEPGSPEILGVLPILENVTLASIKGFVDTYAHRVTPPEAFTAPELVTILKKQFRFFTTYLPKSLQRGRLISLWTDICLDSSDWKGVDEATEVALADRSTNSSAIEKAYIDQLAALEKLSTGSPEQAKRLRLRMSEFLDRYPLSAQWIRVARLYAQAEVEHGEHLKMLPLLEKIHQREPSADSYFRLQFSRFKAGKLKEIIEDKELEKFSPPGPHLAELLREVSLELAGNARKEGDQENYRKYIKKFLDAKPDENKALIARADYFSQLLEKKMQTEATRDYLELPGSAQTAPELANLRMQLWAVNMSTGHYGEASQITRIRKESAPNPEIAYRHSIAKLAYGKAPGPENLKDSSPENRLYLLNILALLHAESVIDYFLKKPPQTPAEKEIAALALRIHNGSWELRRTPDRVKWLGDDFPFVEPLPRTDTPLPFERKIAKLKFPRNGATASELNKLIPIVVSEARKIRAAVPKELGNKPLVFQPNALAQAARVETRVAKMILGSPIPDGLGAEQRKEYDKGISEAASEFENQAKEFEQTAAAIKERLAKEKAQKDARVIGLADMSKWDWPSIFNRDALKPVADALKAKNYLSALTLLDYLRSGNVKDPEDYYTIRTGILLSSSTSEPLRIYLLAELEAAKQQSIIKSWKKLAKDRSS